jgi:hypothetical protein
MTVAPSGKRQRFRITRYDTERELAFVLLESRLFRRAKLSFQLDRVPDGKGRKTGSLVDGPWNLLADGHQAARRRPAQSRNVLRAELRRLLIRYGRQSRRAASLPVRCPILGTQGASSPGGSYGTPAAGRGLAAATFPQVVPHAGLARRHGDNDEISVLAGRLVMKGALRRRSEPERYCRRSTIGL